MNPVKRKQQGRGLRRFASMLRFRGVVPRPGAHCRPLDPR